MRWRTLRGNSARRISDAWRAEADGGSLADLPAILPSLEAQLDDHLEVAVGRQMRPFHGVDGEAGRDSQPPLLHVARVHRDSRSEDSRSGVAEHVVHGNPGGLGLASLEEVQLVILLPALLGADQCPAPDAVRLGRGYDR